MEIKNRIDNILNYVKGITTCKLLALKQILYDDEYIMLINYNDTIVSFITCLGGPIQEHNLIIPSYFLTNPQIKNFMITKYFYNSKSDLIKNYLLDDVIN